MSSEAGVLEEDRDLGPCSPFELDDPGEAQSVTGAQPLENEPLELPVESLPVELTL